jgi:hypothetical protein
MLGRSVNSKLERIRKEAVLSQHLPQGNEENREEPVGVAGVHSVAAAEIWRDLERLFVRLVCCPVPGVQTNADSDSIRNLPSSVQTHKN